MKALKIISLIVLAIILIIVFTAWWAGFFTKINVSDTSTGSYVIAGEGFTGDYSKVGTTIMSVDKKLKDAGIQCKQSFGIYYDDPKFTPRDKCRSFLGSVIDQADYAKLDDIKKLGLKVDTVRQKASLIVEFPYKNKASYFVGPIKAYPALNKQAKLSNYKPTLMMELYDMTMKKITFIMQYEK